jgi:hypothetical protein
VPNIALILQFTLCEKWSRTNAIYLQLRILMLQYTAERISVATGDMPTFRYALYFKFAAKYSANPPIYAMWTVVPDIYTVNTVPHIQASVWNRKYLRCNWRYLDISMRDVLQTGSQIQRTSSSLHYVNCGPGHMQCSYSSAYSGFNIQLNAFALILEICRQFNATYTANMVSNTAHIIQISLCVLWSRPYTMYLLLRIFRRQ